MDHYSNAVIEAEKEVASLESERDRIDERIKHLQEFIVFGKRIANSHQEDPFLLNDQEDPPSTPMRHGTKPQKGTIFAGSISDHMQRILMKAGKPLTSVEIIDQMKSFRKLSRNPWADLSGALKRHPKIFKRIRPGVYELRRRS